MYKKMSAALAGNPVFRFFFLLRKVFLTRTSQRYWSQYGEDIVLDRVLNLKQPGFFVDVGCYHPVKYNNTYKLYRRGWRGVNIDLDRIKIQAFNLRRPSDINVVAAVSDEERTVPLYSTGFYTLTQTIDDKTMQKSKRGGQSVEQREVHTTTLSRILDDTPFWNRKIDVLSVDVEGHELPVLKSLDFERYLPKVIIVESHARALEEILNSELYQFIQRRGFTLFNWTGPSLLFIYSGEK